eukprot:324259-Rhodomonas_salina.1
MPVGGDRHPAVHTVSDAQAAAGGEAQGRASHSLCSSSAHGAELVKLQPGADVWGGAAGASAAGVAGSHQVNVL